MPHESEILDSYQSRYWTLCFPVLFPYGDGVDSLRREDASVTDMEWIGCVLARSDFRWRYHLDFIAVTFNTFLRRQQIRAAKALMKRGNFIHTARQMLKVKVQDLAELATVMGEHASVRDVLRKSGIKEYLRTAIKQMEIAQGRVRCTDAYRTTMRHQMHWLHAWMGPPALFFTLNPAGPRHPGGPSFVSYYEFHY